MSAEAHFIAYTPEQIAKWRGLLTSDPSRVVRTLALRPDQSTREGDTQEDVYAALEAVVGISGFGRERATPIWEALIRAGAIEVLCRNVLEMTVTFRYLPNMPQELIEKAKKEVRSPYFGPLDALCYATCTTHDVPTKTDKRLISVLKKNWSEMMERLWQDPQNTLEPGTTHVRERIPVGQIVARLIAIDQTFLSVILDPSDLTMPVLARQWKYSTSPSGDIQICTAVLYMLLRPVHERHKAYAATHPPPPAAQLLSRIYLGVGPAPASSAVRQAKALVATFADHLWRLPATTARMEVDLFIDILKKAKKDGTEPEFFKALIKFAPFWNSAFRLMKKMAKDPDEEEKKDAKGEDGEGMKRSRLIVVVDLLGIGVNILHSTSLNDPRECEQLVRIWVNEGFFGALEENIESIVAVPSVTMQFSRLICIIRALIPKSSPSFIQLLASQFPRWHILGTLLRFDVHRQQTLPEGISKSVVEMIGKKIPPPNSNFWDHSAWQLFAFLQAECFDVGKMCARRSCGSNGVQRCTICKQVQYCGETCQRKDSKDHKLVCGWMPVLLDSMKRNSETPSLVEELPMDFWR